MRYALLASALIHSCLIFTWWRRPPARPAPVPVPADQPRAATIEVAYEDHSAARPAGTKSKRSLRRNAGRRERGSGADEIRSLAPGGIHPSRVAVVGRTYDPTAEDTSGWSPETWGAGGGGLNHVGRTLAFGRLIDEVDTVLHYPRVLGERRISGVINARLTFRDHSRCAWPPRIDGAHPYLRVYVLAVLNKVCGLDTLESLGFPRGQVVDLSFAFVLTDRSGPGPGSGLGRVAGNVLLFERTYPINQFGYKIGPIAGVWFVPAVSLDWGWVVEHWESWVEGLDPLRDFRE